ncbi:NAD-dependent succinate-semialdehyde dehydrogenase [uncultured Winogradskyella sp.]|uniref:NAD-dependent succinate-semialdehyde dehydrogenase n=1 Tax=uncultured Winogradskyella sp. TaxID=395353 RepID=UPI0026077024|nr:NAD-dependent succinate-semialdehyde dehydrogenase [uncultured Winogradskyella sp.]
MYTTLTSVNPYTGETLNNYHLQNDSEIISIIENSDKAQASWKKRSLKARAELLSDLSNHLEKNKQAFAELITKEMGKPVSESIAEIEKCIWLSDFYKVNAEQFLSDAIIKTDAIESFISYDPLGCILGVMPWNYPFWQVLRFAIPTLTAGNTVLVKHASNVTGCALAIEKLFIDSGFPQNCYQALLTTHDKTESIINHKSVKAVSLTGSATAGKEIATLAGKYLKKTLLELGGTNACIVLEDANLDAHLDTMVKARYQNTGQSCIAAKRFIVVESIYDEFLKKFTDKVSKLKIGDPMDSETDIAVLASDEFSENLGKQVQKSLDVGAKVHYGNHSKNAFYQPTILTNVIPGMSVFSEETFGPVAAIIKAKDTEQALSYNNDSDYGLGAMLFTEDIEKVRTYVNTIDDGSFFVNDMVKSDPRLPFGGTKNSGYGRELSKEGILEFTNKKTVYIK